MEDLELIEEPITEELHEELQEETIVGEDVEEEKEDEAISNEEEEINDLLIEYIRSQLEEEVTEESIEEVVNDTQIEESYDPQIGAILEELRSTESNIEYQSILLDDYTDNNTLQSDINDISLSNLLLIMIFVSILFTSVLNFSRRIF